MKCEVMSGQTPGQPPASDQPDEWLGHSVLLWTLVSMIAVFSGGCATRPLRLQDSYSPPHITSLPNLGAVAIYSFTDRRETGERAVGSNVFRGGTGKNITSSESVAVSVRRAFAEGLRARGFPVVELTGRDLPLESQPGVVVVVSGEIQEFWATWSVGRHRGDWQRDASCKVRLLVSELATGRKLWEKVYPQQYVWDPSMPERNRLDMGPALAKVLALTVEEAVYDPEFVRELRRR